MAHKSLTSVSPKESSMSKGVAPKEKNCSHFAKYGS